MKLRNKAGIEHHCYPARRVAVVFGTRPEIIKLAPVVAQLEARLGGDGVLVVDSGQHYDAAMAGQFWSEFGIKPDIQLASGGTSRSECLGYLVTELGRTFDSEGPAAVIVQGDTNTTLAAAIAANACDIPLVHVEAGLRSYDRAMPEEHNRVLTDHLADLCCAATQDNVENLRGETIPDDRIVLSGNTIVEAVERQLPTDAACAEVLNEFDVTADNFILATIHRPENADDPEVLGTILNQLGAASAIAGVPVVFPMHPRTAAAVEVFGLRDLLTRLQVVEPVGSATFLALASRAALIVSDSGGVAEEVTVLKRPLVVVRRSTERQESIDAGFAHLAAPTEVRGYVLRLLAGGDELRQGLEQTPSPYGDSTASWQIVDATLRLIDVPSTHDA